MKKALFIITIIAVVMFAHSASADPVVDAIFKATSTHDITDKIGIGPNGEMAGITELTVREFMLMSTLYVVTQEYWEPSDKWEVVDNGSCCFGFWAGTKEYFLCVIEKDGVKYVAIDRVF